MKDEGDAASSDQNARVSDKVKEVIGHVDYVGPEGMSGWAVAKDDSTSTLQVAVHLGGRQIATGETIIRRTDVENYLGIRGNAGFAISFGETSVYNKIMDSLSAPTRSNEQEEVRFSVIVENDVAGKKDGTHWTFSLPEGFQADRTRAEWLSYFDIDEEQYGADTLLGGAPTGLSPRPQGGAESPVFIAFYLPQYHPFGENDVWWGPGFTEWTGVSTLQPQYDGHVAPNIPADLGFYDLRLREIREKQGELAKAFGIYGFCNYFYWFSGKRLMAEPLRLILRERKPDIPFCLCWANEPWSRRWDGSESEMLMAQRHDANTDIAIISDLIPYFEDDRYIKIDGKPLFIIYRLSLMPDPVKFSEGLRARARQMGFPDLFICNVMSFGDGDARAWGCDAAVEFPPHNNPARKYDRGKLKIPESFKGEIYDYHDLVINYALREQYGFPYFPGVMPRWDNTARKKEAGTVYQGSSPTLFEAWLRMASVRAVSRNPGAPIVFINSWNEWGEGAHLEPDRRFGRRYLEAVRRVALDDHRSKDVSQLREELQLVGKSATEGKKADTALELGWLACRLQEHGELVGPDPVFSGLPDSLRYGPPVTEGGRANIDNMNGVSSPQVLFTRRAKGVHARGWFVGDVEKGSPNGSFGYLLLERLDGEKKYFAPILDKGLRKDVGEFFGYSEDMSFANFDIRLDLSPVEPGTYRVIFIEVCDHRATRIATNVTIVVA